jgi:tRNA1Val (adenine37-N6)-methyltransferase
MANSFFQFKEFIIHQDRCAMKVSTDSCLFGAWVASIQKNPKNVLDIGGGTGLLTLMVAQKTNSFFDCVEIESECFEQLKANITVSNWKNQCAIFNEDIRNFKPTKKYDLIISNPPFYENQLNSTSDKINLARHHSGLLLADLFDVVERLLTEDGKFFILLPAIRRSECIEKASLLNFFPEYIVDVKQTNKHPIFRSMFCFTKISRQTTVNQIVIKEGDGNYSDVFVSLLKDYYFSL